MTLLYAVSEMDVVCAGCWWMVDGGWWRVGAVLVDDCPRTHEEDVGLILKPDAAQNKEHVVSFFYECPLEIKKHVFQSNNPNKISN